jgi:hypothetical protein
MRLRVVTLFGVGVAAAAFWACSLNPQPFPPDNADGSADATATFKDAAGGSPDGTFDNDGAVPQADAGADASADAANDAADASESDAEVIDARDDAEDAGDGT